MLVITAMKGGGPFWRSPVRIPFMSILPSDLSSNVLKTILRTRLLNSNRESVDFPSYCRDIPSGCSIRHRLECRLTTNGGELAKKPPINFGNRLTGDLEKKTVTQNLRNRGTKRLAHL
jgi:hypothetical protein